MMALPVAIRQILEARMQHATHRKLRIWIEALLRNRAFVREYMAARQQWREGVRVVFPPSTYWLRRFAYVPMPVVQT